MNNTLDIDDIASRAMSSFPVSIGTGLALESIIELKPTIDLYDDTRDIKRVVSLKEYTTAWFNLTTLIRNLSSSVKPELFIKTSALEVAQAIMLEMEIIESIFNIEGTALCKPRFYLSKKADLESNSKKFFISLRNLTTSGQLAYASKVKEIVGIIVKETQSVETFNTLITPKNRERALVLTHDPYDLLSYTNFESLSLLESHTGALNVKFQWYSKYAPVGKEDLSRLPFCKKLFYVFGDKISVMPSPLPIRLRILEIAKQYNWSPLTTLDKINLDFSVAIKDHPVRIFLAAIT